MNKKNGQAHKIDRNEFLQGNDPVFPEPDNVPKTPNNPEKIASEEMLFVPIGSDDLRHLYPELNKYREFKDLTPKEMTFVWYVGCKSSPYRDLQMPLRVSQCADIVWERRPEDAKEYSSYKNMPEHITEAIKKMENFSPNARSRARKMAANILKNYERMAEMSIDAMYVEGIFDWERARTFTETMSKISRDMGNIVFILENGYGVRTKKEIEDNPDEDPDISLVEKFVGG